ncbi:MAG: LpxD N-terminal domain-containing protein, partial [bacterium]
MQTRTLAELAEELQGTVVGDPTTVIRGVAGIREAQAGDLTVLANTRYEGYLAETQASAIICD